MNSLDPTKEEAIRLSVTCEMLRQEISHLGQVSNERADCVIDLELRMYREREGLQAEILEISKDRDRLIDTIEETSKREDCPESLAADLRQLVKSYRK